MLQSSASHHDIAVGAPPLPAAQPAVRAIDNGSTVRAMHELGFADRWARFRGTRLRNLCLLTIEVDAVEQCNVYWLRAAQAAYVSGSDAHVDDLIAVEAAELLFAPAGGVEPLARPARPVPHHFSPRMISDTQVDDACDLLTASMKAARNSNHNGEREVVAAAAGVCLAGLLREFEAANAAESLAWDAGSDVAEVEQRADRAHVALSNCLLQLGLTKAQAERLLS